MMEQAVYSFCKIGIKKLYNHPSPMNTMFTKNDAHFLCSCTTTAFFPQNTRSTDLLLISLSRG